MHTHSRVSRVCLAFTIGGLVIFTLRNGRGDTWNWDPGSNSDAWSDATNWDPPSPTASPIPANDGTADISFTFPSQFMGNLSHVDVAWSVHSLAFSSNLDRDLYGEELTIGDGGINVQSNPGGSSQPILIQNDVKLSASQTWTVSDNFTASGSIDTNGLALSISANPASGPNNAFGVFLTGAITGNGSVSFLGPGGVPVQLSGDQSNTYSGLTTVNYGVLELAKTNNAVAIAGDLVIGVGSDPGAVSGIVRLLGEGQLASTSNLTLQKDGTFDLNGHSSSIATLSGSGLVTNNGSAESLLHVNPGVNATSTFGGTLADGSGTLRVAHDGGGIVVLSGNNTNREVDVNGGGTLRIAGTNTSYISVSNGRIEGTGSTSGTLEAGPNNSGSIGTLAPGGGNIGTLTAGALWIAQNGVLEIQLNSDNLTNDQIVLTGGTNPFGHGVDITSGSGGAATGALTLRDLGSTALAIGQTFTIVMQTGSSATVGSFDGLPEGADINVGSNTYAIHYHGGASMEDIFLEVVSPVPEPSTWVAAVLTAAVIGQRLLVKGRKRSLVLH